MAPRIESMEERDIGGVVEIDGASDHSAHWDAASVAAELGRTYARLWVSREGRSPEGGSPEGASPDGSVAPPRLAAFLVTWVVQDELHVLNIATHPEHRRRGHARALLDHALAYGRAHGVRILLLEVRRSNAGAIELYRRLGFVAMGIRTRYYADDEDAVEMLLRLDPTTGAVLAGPDEVTL